jgi:hypothetical protein
MFLVSDNGIEEVLYVDMHRNSDAWWSMRDKVEFQADREIPEGQVVVESPVGCFVAASYQTLNPGEHIIFKPTGGDMIPCVAPRKFAETREKEETSNLS